MASLGHPKGSKRGEKMESVKTAVPVIKNKGPRDFVWAKSVKNAIPVIKNRDQKKNLS